MGDNGDFDYKPVVAPLLVLSSCVCVCDFARVACLSVTLCV